MNSIGTETKTTPLQRIENLDNRAHDIAGRVIEKLIKAADNMFGSEPPSPESQGKGSSAGIGWFAGRIDSKTSLNAVLAAIENQADRFHREINQ